MEHPCAHCDHPDSSLLRVVLIGEIVRADEATLGAVAEIFRACGLLEAVDDADGPRPKAARKPQPGTLRLVK